MNVAQRVDYVLSGDTPDTWTRDADAISIPRIDESGAAPRPPEIGPGQSYPEHEYRAMADEQQELWPAQGEREARPFQVRACGLDRPTEATDYLLAQNKQEVQEAQADYQHAARVLAPHVHRAPWVKVAYFIGMPILWLGDTTGVWSAAVTNGDIVYIAAGQALSAGLSAVCAGLVGAELKHLQLARARRRDPESLTEDEQRYRRLFSGTDDGNGIVKLIGLLSLTVVLMLAVGIGTLRSSIEGSASGLTFGLLAAATAIGSLLLGFWATDEVADLLATTAKRVRRAERRHLKLAAAAMPKAGAEATEAARSIQAEYQLRGQAAARRVEALSFRILRNNAGVFGHGYPAGEQGGVIGRRSRRGGVA
jgi:hypothetical protein